MCVICTFQDSRELRISDTGLLAGGTYGTWADADFDDVCTGEDKRLGHLSSYHVAGLERVAKAR